MFSPKFVLFLSPELQFCHSKVSFVSFLCFATFLFRTGTCVLGEGGDVNSGDCRSLTFITTPRKRTTPHWQGPTLRYDYEIQPARPSLEYGTQFREDSSYTHAPASFHFSARIRPTAYFSPKRNRKMAATNGPNITDGQRIVWRLAAGYIRIQRPPNSNIFSRCTRLVLSVYHNLVLVFLLSFFHFFSCSLLFPHPSQ